MRLLITLLLISTTVLAQYRVDVSNKVKNINYASKFDTQQEADDWIVENKKNNSWGKGVLWETIDSKADDSDCLATKTVISDDGVKSKQCQYPAQYTVKTTDISADVAAEETKLQARKTEIDKIKTYIDEVESSGKPAWEQELLIRLIKELRE